MGIYSAAMTPVSLLTGFLGAGKTTLLRHVLQQAHGQRVAVVMNEVDQAGIEEQLAQQTYLELTEGCVCCVRNPDLIAALRELSARDDIDRIVLETTGLADPLQLVWTIQRPELADCVTLDAVVTVLDPTSFQQASSSSEWEAQIEAADLAILTKLDVANDAQKAALVARVSALNPQLRLLDHDEPELWRVFFDSWREPASPEAAVLGPGPRHSDFAAHRVTGGRFRADALERALEHLPMQIFRAKGIVDTDEGWLRFHLVAGRLQVEPNVAAPPHGETRMSFFGRALQRVVVEHALDVARLPT